MNETQVSTIARMAKELLELYARQVNTLRQGTLANLPEGELKRYSDRKRRARDLYAALTTLRVRRIEARPWAF
jgi:hypothetical protein